MDHDKIGPDTGLQGNWDTCKTWISSCIEKHTQCSPRSIAPLGRQLPRRLVEVGGADTVRLRAVRDMGEGISTIQYIALSHCWGFGPRVKLTSNSAAVLYKGIEISALSKTFQDAILVTKRFWDDFGIRYLWIDSLCIVQDSVEDWRRESAIMGEIYQNAFCTLAATAAEDGNCGLFLKRDPRRILPCAIPVVSKGHEQRTFYCVDHENWANNVSRAPLNGRSWVLQERLLSCRILHFTADQVYWECSGLEASEVFPKGLVEGCGERFKQLLPFAGLPETKQLDPGRGPYGIWDRIIKMYSSGKLTKMSDRLVALSGIAHKVQRLIIPHDTYLAGLWKHDLPFGLLWDVEDSQVQNFGKQYIAPTWSWASRAGVVPCKTETWASAGKLIEITIAKVLPAGKDHMGQVLLGHIGLSGVLARGYLSRKHQPGSSVPGIALEVSGKTVYSAICRPDDGVGFDIPVPRNVYCLPIFRGRRDGIPRYRGLLLLPSGREREFRRYGTFEADSFGNEFLVSCKPPSFATGVLRPNGHYEIIIV